MAPHCLENSMGWGAWKAAVHGVAKSWTQLSDFTFTFHFHALEKEMATHSSVLAWRIPGIGEPGGLLSIGSHRIWHDWSDLAAAAAILHRVYVPQLSYPFICWWTSRLLPCPGYYKQSKMYLIEKAQRNSDVKGPWLICFFILLLFSFSLFFKVYVLCCPLLTHFSHVWIFATLWAAAHQAPLSIEFSQQEYWSGLPCPPPGDLPDLGFKPASPALQMDSLPLKHLGRPT